MNPLSMEAPEWNLYNLVPGAPADCLVHTCKPAYLQLPASVPGARWLVLSRVHKAIKIPDIFHSGHLPSVKVE